MKKHYLTDLLGGTITIETHGGVKEVSIAGIEIPIIQRDYAQGRPEEAIIRRRFLDALFQALASDRELELDFVYGSLRRNNSGKGDTFLPLDGQQRLTTLYLLYLYLCNAELGPGEQVAARQQLAQFSYATRSSARDFCQALASISLGKNAAGQIRGAYWFHKSFEKDPTVMAMLNTLADIEERYVNQGQRFFGRFNRLCFYILPLDGFNLTDELYIKMNARGKQLTDFENFKADLVNRLKDPEHPGHQDLMRHVPYGGSSMPYYLVIASKTDNSWTDIFWPVARQNEEDDQKFVDPYFLRFINRYTLHKYITLSNRPLSEIENSECFRQLYGAQGNDSAIRYQQFNHYTLLTSLEPMAQLELLLDNLYEHQHTIRQTIRAAWDKEKNWFIYDEAIDQTQRILFLGATLYLEQHQFDAERFADWIRVVWNIIIDPDIRSIPAMITAMKTIHKLSAGSGDIYHFLESEAFEAQFRETSNVHREQLDEERQKVRLFKQEGWRQAILSAEAHGLFQGNIGFLLSGSPDLPLFRLRLDNAMLLFDENGACNHFRKDFGVYRYLVSSFENWDSLYNFNYIDNGRNWQLSLRRNNACRKAIAGLCSYPDAAAMQEQINAAIAQPSAVSGWDEHPGKLCKIHESLYREPAFVSWTQQHGLSKLKWLYEHVYLIRPGAWYDKVMIDCYRNELIARFCKLAQVSTEHRCGNSGFFWNEDIELTILVQTQQRKVLFRKDNHVQIRLPKENDNILTWEILKDFPPAVGTLQAAHALAEQLADALTTSAVETAAEQ